MKILPVVALAATIAICQVASNDMEKTQPSPAIATATGRNGWSLLSSIPSLQASNWTWHLTVSNHSFDNSGRNRALVSEYWLDVLPNDTLTTLNSRLFGCVGFLKEWPLTVAKQSEGDLSCNPLMRSECRADLKTSLAEAFEYHYQQSNWSSANSCDPLYAWLQNDLIRPTCRGFSSVSTASLASNRISNPSEGNNNKPGKLSVWNMTTQFQEGSRELFDNVMMDPTLVVTIMKPLKAPLTGGTKQPQPPIVWLDCIPPLRSVASKFTNLFKMAYYISTATIAIFLLQ